ncbi:MULTISPECIES: ATP-binding cassette domain-containing protein [unclassified Devosia]|uniref:ATP-binding cassette domain-containing protein n=1 Tax=unclassified Devosia TaxID=196773 RepID=UPI00086DFA9F|nr:MULTISPECIES: ATP-binding cassette domain-containing protein [unclassified Devosia]MBN9360066.1 ATP-binding cassette domain-containing protein [Devosia sp.]ODS86720.1 MAG: peptide ABC transporter ATP-binding protein [Devosia sp. SCN 66-27]OJX22123.1 MAG: peptide ABC transporter ATP-binding protein [Devosia sp. 66-14]
MSLVSVDNVSFGYTRDRLVLDGVSLEIRAGASVGLVGESGSGKTTLLRLLLGLTRPSAGQIRFDDTRLESGNAGFMRDYRRQVQAVFQDPYSSLDPRQNVLGIVSEPLRSLRIPGDRRALVEAALVSVGLEPGILGRYPHEFSGGQRQRIAIARAIVARPKLLLADEAVSALDLSTRIRIVELLQQLAAEMTLVFVSHDLGVVAALCEEMVILERGRIVEAGATRKILADPQHQYTRKLLGSVPRMPA